MRVGTDRITVAFAGATTAAVVDLGSESTVLVEDLTVSGCRDLARVRSTVGSRIGGATYSTRLDVNNDGVITVRDVEAIQSLLPSGATCSS